MADKPHRNDSKKSVPATSTSLLTSQSRYFLYWGLSGLHLAAIFAVLLLSFPWFVDASGQYLNLYNSDLIHPFMLLEDLFEDKTALFSWHHTPAPYIFPDWILVGLLVALEVPRATMPALYAPIILTLYSLSVGYTLRLLTGRSLWVGAWLTTLLTVCAGLLILHFRIPHVSSFLYVTLGAPYIHTGALLLAVISPGLFFVSLFRPKQYIYLASLAFIVLLGSFSDMIYVAWFALPAIVVGCIYYWSNRERQALTVTLIVSFAAAIGHLVETTFYRMRHNYMATAERSVPESLNWLSKHIGLAINDIDIPSLLILLFCLALLVRGTFLLVQLLDGTSLGTMQFIELLFALMITSALVAPLATGMLGEFGSLRYYLPATYLPFTWGLYLFIEGVKRSDYLNKIASTTTSYSVLLIGLLFFYQHYSDRGLSGFKQLVRYSHQYPLQNCLLDFGLSAGFSDYWNAKLLMHVSDRKLHLVQINSIGIPFRWNTNENWLRRRADSQSTPEFSFILIERLDPAVLAKTYGVPEEKVSCGGKEVWVYSQPIQWQNPP